MGAGYTLKGESNQNSKLYMSRFVAARSHPRCFNCHETRRFMIRTYNRLCIRPRGGGHVAGGSGYPLPLLLLLLLCRHTCRVCFRAAESKTITAMLTYEFSSCFLSLESEQSQRYPGRSGLTKLTIMTPTASQLAVACHMSDLPAYCCLECLMLLFNPLV